MPKENVTIDVVRDGYHTKNYILARDGVKEPAQWKTVTLNAGDGKFEKHDKNRTPLKTLTFYVNPLYEVELLRAEENDAYFEFYSLYAPEGKIISKPVKKQFTANETITVEYKAMPEITLNLHKKDKTTIDTITIPGKSTYEDIKSTVRSHQSELGDDEKFVCWSTVKDQLNDSFASKYNPQSINSYRNVNGTILEAKYDDYLDYDRKFVGARYDGFKTTVDLYEVVTKKTNPVVNTFSAYEHEYQGEVDLSSYRYDATCIVNPDAKEKFTFGNIAASNRFDKTKLYKITDLVAKTHVELDLSEKITSDVDTLDIIKDNEDNPHPTLYVKGEPRVNYTKENEAKLDLSHIVLAVVDKEDERKETYIPFEDFKARGIKTIPANEDILDASYNGKSIKVMYNGNFAYTEEALIIEKESALYVPVYDKLEKKVEDFVATKIKFLDEKSTETSKPEASKKPTAYKVTFVGEGLPDATLYDNGQFYYTVKEEDAGKTIKLPVLITYRDSSTDNAEIVINVKPLDDQSAAPTVEDVVEGATVINGTGVEGATIKILKGTEVIAENIVVGNDGKWKAENIDATKLKADDKLTIEQTENGKKPNSIETTVKAKTVTPEEKKDNEKYNPTATNITKNFGEATTEDEVKAAVSVADYPQDKDAYTVTVDDPSKLPDGQTAADFNVAVTVTYPDQSTDKLTVKVTVKAKAPTPEDKVSIAPAYHGKVYANPSNPLPGDLVRLTAIPDNGFELDYFDVRDQFDNPVKVYGDYFYMPDGPVTVYPVFKEIGSYHRPYYPDNYEYRYRRNRKDNNEEDTIVEENPVKVYEAIALVTIGSKKLEKTVNGVHTVTLMDVAAQIKNGRTMIPLRYVAEALGFNVTWIKETRTVVIYDNQFKVEIPVDTNRIIVNGVKFESDVKPQIVNNRTLLPIANIARALGLKDGTDILWNPVTRQATIIRRVYSK
ncbi:stalk domain-containing protein [Fenollaria massiliensis]|uniref:stalk domain-containing protein n=1 Tax=Fenollaria massiliensis TaxID=938288 RepID=UPI0003613C50|nr:stalk domain-containing protein [Fenollaria massiliensis]